MSTDCIGISNIERWHRGRQYINGCRFAVDSKLCVVTVLKEYIDDTSALRGDEQQLFISYAKPHHGVSKATISRWIGTVMQKAGIDTTLLKLHST